MSTRQTWRPSTPAGSARLRCCRCPLPTTHAGRRPTHLKYCTPTASSFSEALRQIPGRHVIQRAHGGVGPTECHCFRASKPAPYDQRACGFDAGVFVEFLCDTTRAATNLIFSGTMKKYPRIRWILAHAGGCLTSFGVCCSRTRFPSSGQGTTWCPDLYPPLLEVLFHGKGRVEQANFFNPFCAVGSAM